MRVQGLDLPDADHPGDGPCTDRESVLLLLLSLILTLEPRAE
jgi:hypothetical protein